MFVRNVYFVRHGETILNAARIRQGEAGGLSENGKLQVLSLAARIENFKIKKIFCSPFERAVETADIINQKLNKQIEYVPLLKERRNPSSIVGKSYDDLEVQNKIDAMDKSFHAPDMRIEDEENFTDLKERALKARDFLAKNTASDTLVVTHGIFLKMLLCVMIYDKDLTVHDYIRLTVFNPADNAGITVVQYDPLSFFSSNPWKIIAYNDSPVNHSALKI